MHSAARPLGRPRDHVRVQQASQEGNADEASRVSLVLALQVSILACLSRRSSAPVLQPLRQHLKDSDGDEGQVFGAQGSEHASFLRRRALWFWLQALQMILYIVIIVLCVATPHNFSGAAGDLAHHFQPAT